MKLINQNVEEWHCGYTLPEIWSHIAKCARTCYQSEPRNNGETDEEFVKRVILRNHSLEEIGKSRELQLKLHCYTGDSSVLTSKGWIKWKDYNGEDVAVINKDLTFKGFETPSNVIKHDYKGKFYNYETLGLKVTDKHRMFGAFRTNANSLNKCNNYQIIIPNNPFVHNNYHYTDGQRTFKVANTCVYKGEIDSLYELVGFWLGDGCNINNGTKHHCLTFHLKRKDKIKYLKELCDKLNYTLVENKDNMFVVKASVSLSYFYDKYIKDGVKYISIRETDNPSQIAGVISGLIHSDGSIKSNTIAYGSTSKYLVNYIANNAPLIGYSVSNIRKDIKENKNWNDFYSIQLLSRTYNIVNDSRKPNSKVKITEENLPVYCVSVSTGLILVKGCNGVISICGNCSVLEHGTVYIDIPNNMQTMEFLNFFRNNKYSKTYQHGNLRMNSVAVTTNMRVIVENNLMSCLTYLCTPTEYHFLRTTCSIITDIGVARELARHRTHSISEESTRYCNYSKDKFNNELTFIKHCWLNDEKLKLYGDYHTVIRDKSPESIFIANLNNVEKDYLDLIKLGWTPQQARQILPLSTKVQTIHTAFESDWAEFISLRANACSGSVHPNMKVIANKIICLMAKKSD